MGEEDHKSASFIRKGQIATGITPRGRIEVNSYSRKVGHVPINLKPGRSLGRAGTSRWCRCSPGRESGAPLEPNHYTCCKLGPNDEVGRAPRGKHVCRYCQWLTSDQRDQRLPLMAVETQHSRDRSNKRRFTPDKPTGRDKQSQPLHSQPCAQSRGIATDTSQYGSTRSASWHLRTSIG